MNKVLMTAVIVLPLVMFLAFFGDNIMQTFQGNAGDAQGAADDLKSTAENSGWSGD